MTHRPVVIKHIEEGGWQVVWGDTWKPADERLFASLEEAGRVARTLMGVPGPEPKLRLVKPSEDPNGGTT